MPAELVKELAACVNARHVSAEILWGSEVEHFLGHNSLTSFYTRL